MLASLATHAGIVLSLNGLLSGGSSVGGSGLPLHVQILPPLKNAFPLAPDSPKPLRTTATAIDSHGQPENPVQPANLPSHHLILPPDNRTVVPPVLTTERVRFKSLDFPGLFLEAQEPDGEIAQLLITLSSDMEFPEGTRPSRDTPILIRAIVNSEGEIIALQQPPSDTDASVALPNHIADSLLQGSYLSATINGQSVTSFLEIRLHFRYD